ncbi:MAG: hypothetical protein L6R38_006493 [Xanthoria sp. 2 TBL-2021]|nr:MAG: hypothetical protein L6R38_006493 [Xanthoria sp. 2 TBL-2021]
MASSNTDSSSFTTCFFNNTDMGRRYRNAEVVTAPFGRSLIEKAGLLSPNLDNITILDNACGTGVVSSALHEMMPLSTKGRMKLTMGDFSEPMLKVARERCEAEGWVHTEGRIVDAQKTNLPDSTFSHVLTSFAIMGLQDPTAALNECHRILKPGGTCAFSTWSSVSWISIVRSAFATLPGPPPFPSDLEMYRSWGVGDWHSPDWIRSYLISPSLTSPPLPSSVSSPKFNWQDVEVESVEKEIVMESSEKFVDTFSVMVPMILNKFWSERERKELGDMAVPRLLEWMEGEYRKGKEVRMRWVANLVVAKKGLEGSEVGK